MPANSALVTDACTGRSVVKRLITFELSLKNR